MNTEKNLSGSSEQLADSFYDQKTLATYLNIYDLMKLTMDYEPMRRASLNDQICQIFHYGPIIDLERLLIFTVFCKDKEFLEELEIYVAKRISPVNFKEFLSCILDVEETDITGYGISYAAGDEYSSEMRELEKKFPKVYQALNKVIVDTKLTDFLSLFHAIEQRPKLEAKRIMTPAELCCERGFRSEQQNTSVERGQVVDCQFKQSS